MLDTSGSRIRVECGPVAASMLRARLLFFIKFPKVNAASDMRMADLLLISVRKGAFLRSGDFLRSPFQA